MKGNNLMEDDYNLEELIKYTTLENFILSGYITESIRQEVKKLKECGNEEVRHFLDDINVDIDKQCLQRDKDHPIISPDYTINIKVPQEGIIQMLFYVYNHEKGDDDRVSNFLLEHINEDIEKRKKAVLEFPDTAFLFMVYYLFCFLQYYCCPGRNI